MTIRKEDLRNNLFSFATKELSHSAFWAWILQSVDTKGNSSLKIPRRIGRRFIKTIGYQEEIKSIEVEREVKVESGCRLDVVATINNRTLLVIENKVKARPRANQLEQYAKDLNVESKDVLMVLLSCAFDKHIRPEIEREGKWKYLGVDEIQKIIGRATIGHPLVDDYANWIKFRKVEEKNLVSMATSDNYENICKALEDRRGQWGLMDSIVGEFEGEIHTGTNKSGSPRMTFWFSNYDEVNDGFFYRIDKNRVGPYFSLRQYQNPPSPTIEQKFKRRDRLRVLWNEIMDEVNTDFVMSSPGHGKNESEIMLLQIKDNMPSKIKREMKRVHELFQLKVKAEGWKISI